MALELKLSVCFKDKCSKLQISDATGAYSTNNTTGWGAPNLALGDVTEATLTVTPPNVTSATNFDVTTTVTSATIVEGLFILKTVQNSDLTGGALVDGIYTITYEVTDGEDTYTTTIKTFSTCKADCCVEKMKAKFKKELCGCNWKTFWDNYKKAEALLYGAKSAFACGKEDEAKDLLDQVNKICSIQKCCC